MTHKADLSPKKDRSLKPILRSIVWEIIIYIPLATLYTLIVLALAKDLLLEIYYEMPVIYAIVTLLAILVQGVLDFSQLNADYMNAPVPGEIIVFRVPGQPDPIVHRAIAKEYRNNHWYFDTKGDANLAIDSWSPVSQDYIIGKVVGKAPWLGNLSLFMREHPFEGVLLIAIAIAVSIFVDFSFPRKKKHEIKMEALQQF